MPGDSKTEKATPKKRRDERKKGNVLMSKDAVAVATLMGSLFILQTMAPFMLEQIELMIKTCFTYIGEGYAGMVPYILSELIYRGLMAFIIMAGPLLGVTALLAIAATFFQTRLLVSTEAIKPKFNRISPIEGFQRLFSLRSIVEALKGILKITVLLVLIYDHFKKAAAGFFNFLDMDLTKASSILFGNIFDLVVQIGIAFAALAFLDYLYQWWDYERKLRMSKQEIKEEYKQTEGDPQIKSKIKGIQRQRAQSRMMQQVPKADVVIRNPTHFAVALRYRPEEDNAPVVLAKGVDAIAIRIAQVAQEHQITVVENVSLARALYAAAELDREIPPELYGAVAEILVYVLKLDAQVPGGEH
jgi:flagellar biosynthetic protein FlhB